MPLKWMQNQCLIASIDPILRDLEQFYWKSYVTQNIRSKTVIDEIMRVVLNCACQQKLFVGSLAHHWAHWVFFVRFMCFLVFLFGFICCMYFRFQARKNQHILWLALQATFYRFLGGDHLGSCRPDLSPI